MLFVPLVTLLCNQILEVYSELCSLEGCRKAMLVLDVDFISPFPVYYPNGLPLVGVVLSVGLGFLLCSLYVQGSYLPCEVVLLL